MTPTRPGRELRPAILARYATGEFVTSGFAALPGLVLVFYLTDALGVPALLAGVVVTLAKVWDIVIDPVVGGLSDRELAATGRRRRLMRLAAVLLPLFFVVTFVVPAGLPPLASAAWVFVAFLLAATGFSLFQVPYNVLPAELTRSYDERTRLLSARVVVLAIAILLYGGGGPLLRGLGGDLAPSVGAALGIDLDPVAFGYLLMAVGAAAGFAIAIFITSGIERAARGETPPAPPATDPYAQLPAPRDSLGGRVRRGWGLLRSSRPFRALLTAFMIQGLATGMMLGAAQYVATWVLVDEDAVTLLFVALIAPALVAAPIWGAVARRIGKERAYLIAIVLFGVAALSLVLLVWAPGLWVYAPVGLAGFAYAGLQALPLSMLPDVIAHDARSNGPGRGGGFSGMWTAGETIGLAFGATVLSLVLAATGYLESTAGVVVEQGPAAVLGIIACFSVLPAALMSVSTIALGRYPLRRGDIDVQGPAPSVIPGSPPPA